MGIIFICSCLEYGRDGVGDYTRRLAAELIKRGTNVGVIALNDRYINENVDGVQTVDALQIKVLRLSVNYTYQKRFARATKWVANENPEWLSLQYVPFGFNNKGLPFGLAKHLSNLGKGKKWHVMFHELWVGMDAECDLKFKIWGWVQRGVIKAMIKKLKPAVVNTQTSLYKEYLLSMGTASGLLPLFSNIPVAYQNNGQAKDKSILRVVLFGSIHFGAPVAAFAKEIAEWGKSNTMNIEVAFVGRNGNEAAHWKDILHSAGITTKATGEATPLDISAALQNADWGIVTTPVSLIEKSGAYAAMREHALPVLCINRKWTPREVTVKTQIEGVFEYIPGLLQNILNTVHINRQATHRYTVYHVAEQLLGWLS